MNLVKHDYLPGVFNFRRLLLSVGMTKVVFVLELLLLMRPQLRRTKPSNVNGGFSF
jgi:hypothetical protein